MSAHWKARYNEHMSKQHVYHIETTTAEETKSVASALACLLQEGDVVLLSGDLGAGKTQFVQGVARGLRVEGEVTSPTFNILLTYEGDLPLYHFDLYRLDEPEQLDDIGFYEVLEGDGATFIEWAEKFPGEMPDDALEVAITVEPNVTRNIAAGATGPRSSELLDAWAATTGLRADEAKA